MSQDGPTYVGRELGNYRLAEVLGRGGMSVVYRAIHKAIESEVAIKVLRSSSSHDMVKRFFHEAVAASQIRHPGIVSVFDYGQHGDGSPYLVMELLSGENLADRLRRRGSLEPVDAVRLVRQVCGALIAAHDAEIIHRDIKPQNLFIVRDADVSGGERIKVLDFGVAKMAPGGGPGSEVPGPDDAGALIGTPIYMAPEQFRGGDAADVRTDVYQVGAVLYHMLSGRPPFIDLEDRMRGLAADGAAAPPRLRSAPAGLEAVVRRCLEREPDRRYPDMRALEDALRRCAVELDGEDAGSIEDAPTMVQHVPDLSRENLASNILRVRGMHSLASASVASGFFEHAPLSGSRLFGDGGSVFAQVRQTFEFYRKHLDDEFRQLSGQIESSHRLWIACVGVGFAILIAGLLAVLLGRVTQGVVTSSASTMVYFIVRVFQNREDYYREQQATKVKYLHYGNDWLLLIQSIEAIPDPADRLEEQRRLARVLLDRMKGGEVAPAPEPAGDPPAANDPIKRRPRRVTPAADEERRSAL